MWKFLIATLVIYLSGLADSHDAEGFNKEYIAPPRRSGYGSQTGPTPSCAEKCFYRHPQIVFCKDDFVAKVTIVKYLGSNSQDARYEILVRDVMKGGADAYDKKILYTECGTASHHPFYEGKNYLIMGRYDNKGEVVMNSCDFSISMREMNCYQRKGILKQNYAANCICADQIGHDGAMRCVEQTQSDLCYSTYAYCRYNEDKQRCGWAKFWKFAEC